MSLNKSLFSSEKMDWETPKELFDKLNREFKFTLDVCALPHNAKCRRYFTPDIDGLSQPWDGVCWMNPPYGREIGSWVIKAAVESYRGCVCVCLVPVRSDSKWWHDYVMRSAEIRLLTRRVTFVGAGANAPFPACIVVFDKKKGTTPQLSSYRI